MNIVESSLQELFGIICWEPKWDCNLNLSINFGQPHLSISEPREVKSKDETIRQTFRLRGVTLHGDWLFWVLSAYWKLSINDFGDVTGASTYRRKKMALARLEGQKLTYASVNPSTCATQLDFDLGARLSIRRTSIMSKGDIWSLYKPDGYVLSVRANGNYHDDPGDTNLEKIKWKPIVMI
jgi:hypothetical protein